MENVTNVTIDLSAIRANVERLRAKIKPGVKICAVVKANAYSFGDKIIAKTIETRVDMFAVAHLAEATRLRKGGIAKDILLLGVCTNLARAEELGLVLSINSVAEVQEIIDYKRQNPCSVKKFRVHVKVNTGLNRYGIQELEELEAIFDLASERNFIIEGIYTHFAHEEDNIDGIREQLKRFEPFRALASQFSKQRGESIIIHTACAGSAHISETQFDMVRVGKSFYGGYWGYQTVIEVTSKITAVQNIKKGETVGYGATFVADKDMTVGIVPCGYADLGHVNFSNRCACLIYGVPAPIVGRMSMDTMILNVTDIPNPLGQTVRIIGDAPGITIMEHARNSNSVTCDILCGMRFERADLVYLEK